MEEMNSAVEILREWMAAELSVRCFEEGAEQ